MASAEQFAVEPLTYRGSRNRYVDIALRGADEHLGLSIEYAVHPSNIGCFILRFVVHGEGIAPQNFTHLTFREGASFVKGTGPHKELFKGVRLNKLAIPVFNPGVQRQEIGKFGDQFGIFPAVTEWIAEQVQAEGFSLTVDLEKQIRGLLIPTATPEDAVKSVIEFPNLTSPEYKALAAAQMVKPEPDENDKYDEDTDDDGDGDDKPYLN